MVKERVQCSYVGNKTIVKVIKLRKLVSHKSMRNVKCSTENNINNKDAWKMFTETLSFLL